MPTTNRRSCYNRPKQRPSVPSYSRRSNSNRKDIRLDNRRKRRNNSPNLIILIIIIAVCLVGLVVLMILSGSEGNQLNVPPSSTTEKTSNYTMPKDGIVPGASAPSSGDSSEATNEGLIYTDDRIPNYSAANPIWETIHFEWESQDKRGTMQIDIAIDSEMYKYYRSLGRYYGIIDYPKYINDVNNKTIISEIVKVIRNVANNNSYSDAAVVREIAKFVQDAIEYQYDSDTAGEDEYPRYPIETLYERQGDCEDTSILMAALLKELGYEVGFLHLPGHLAVALRTSDNYSDGAYYEINGHRYLYIESTGSGWNIGDIPEDIQGQQATFYAIS